LSLRSAIMVGFGCGRALRGKANREKAVWSYVYSHVNCIKRANGICIILCVTETIVAM
jgi:hypothetical protein